MDDQDIRNRSVETLLRKRVVGAKKQQVDTVVGYSVPTHARGRARTLLEQKATDPAAPVERYGGGQRENVRLTSVQEAVDYLDENDGSVPFSFT